MVEDEKNKYWKEPECGNYCGDRGLDERIKCIRTQNSIKGNPEDPCRLAMDVNSWRGQKPAGIWVATVGVFINKDIYILRHKGLFLKDTSHEQNL